MAEGEVDYESDPEEAKLSLKMRRREASDDEEEEGERWGDRVEKTPHRIDDLEEESEGAAAEYEDDLEEGVEEGYYVDEEYVDDGELQYGESIGGEIGGSVEATAVNNGVGNTPDIVADKLGQAKNGGIEEVDFENDVSGAPPEEQKKEIEPFAVPTAGAFYMHDDRFRESIRGRNRRMLGGRKLWPWESKDERKWGHDKYEELTMQERHHGERRRGSRGRSRGRGRSQGTERVYTQVNRSKVTTSYGNASNNSQGSVSKGNASKSTRGRGPHKYQQSFKNYDGSRMANRKSERTADIASHIESTRTSGTASNAELERTLPKKPVASSLNVASPPFYPTTKDNNMTNRRDAQSVSNGGDPHSISSKGNAVGQSIGMIRGKSTVDSINVDKLHLDDSPYGISRRQPSSMQMPSSGSLVSNPHTQLRSPERAVDSLVQMAYQPVVSGNQVNRAPSSGMTQSGQRNLAQFRSQPPLQSSQQFTQRFPTGSASSPPKALEREELDSAAETNHFKTESGAKGKENVQGLAKGSFMYGGAQVLGASGSMGRGHTDPNFPAFLPVMQFGGQHPGGIGVPAVGMAFPGYVAQPQLGIGSSEMTWLPVLASAAGPLGAAYCPPYITMDGSYNSRAGSSSSVSHSLSKENNEEKPSSEWMPSQNSELLTEEVGQRQRNPRRYTEMKFDK